MTLDWLHILLVVLLIGLSLYQILNKQQTKPPLPTLSELHAPVAESALQCLSLLQKEARLIDFLQQDLTHFSDAEVGVAARVVHAGGVRVLQNYFTLQPIRSEQEESRITVEAGFNPAEIRLVGRLVGEAPFQGLLTHRGWRVTETRLPQLSEGHNSQVIAPAEVEV